MNRSSARRTAPWLGRFELPILLRSQGAFHLGATREPQGGERCVVVFAAPGCDTGKARRALGELARVHRLLSHPLIAPVIDTGEHEGVPFVVLGCDAVADLGVVLREARRAGQRAPHNRADGFILGLREALQAAHQVSDQGKPVCLGALSYGNVLFNRAGKHWLVGFGHNVAAFDEEGGLLGGEPIFQAPEVNVGGPASPSGDYVALILMMRSALSAVSLVPAVAGAVVGQALAGDTELLRSLLWFERRVIAALPAQRATIDEAILVSNRIRAFLGVVPDPEGFEREAAAALGRLLPGPPGGALRVGPDASWMEAPDGSTHQLGSRAPLRRILLSLAEARLQRPGAALPVDALIEAGWPGERPAAGAGANRAYVLLSELRRMGLRGVLQRHDDGYRLDPSLAVRFEARQGE